MFPVPASRETHRRLAIFFLVISTIRSLLSVAFHRPDCRSLTKPHRRTATTAFVSAFQTVKTRNGRGDFAPPAFAYASKMPTAPHVPFSRRKTSIGAGSSLAATSLSSPDLGPPEARRDESLTFLAGVLPPLELQPPNDDDEEVKVDEEDKADEKDDDEEDEEEDDISRLRQSATSTYPLLDPAVSIPNPYGWIRDDSRKNPEVLKHLEDENAHTTESTRHLSELREKLYEEMLSSIQETDHSAPARHGPWSYYTRTFEKKSYSVYCRAPFLADSSPTVWDGSPTSPILPGETTYLDLNELAKDKPYCSEGSVEGSPSHELIAYTVDFSGGEVLQLFIKNATTEEIIDHDPSLECDGEIVWGPDDSSLFYVTMDDRWRSYRVYRRRVPAVPGEKDELLFEESDEMFGVAVGKSSDERFLFVSTESGETAEVHYLDLTDPEATLRCISKRRKKVLYEVEHREGMWLIATNAGGTPNMRLTTCQVGEECEDLWEDMKDQNQNVMFDGGYDRSLDSITSFKGHVVAEGREGGIPRVWVVSYDGLEVDDFNMLEFSESAYDVELGSNYEYDTDELRLVYDSLITPPQSIQISMTDHSQRTVIKQKNVPGYDINDYAWDRITVTSRDNATQIPVSLVYRKDAILQTPAPLHLYGYGSYGSPMESGFDSTRIPLLERGIIFAIAHVRGGGEMGRQWYEEPNGGKYLCKNNTFDDFVDVARCLIEEKKMTSPDQLSMEGRSAGGMLIGAVMNRAPELFKVALLGVPFVDVLCTMVDATIPLTAEEWEEWGNPNEERFFKYIKEYCPVSNVKAGAKYPACLLTGGLHDPRVQYWEPAKFAAELRHGQGADSGPVCLKIDMTSGHFSASDRYKYLKELAFDYAFMLDHLGLASGPLLTDREEEKSSSQS